MDAHPDFWTRTPLDYRPVYAARAARLARLREHPAILAAALDGYRADPVKLIEHWARGFEARSRGRGQPTESRQVDLIRFILERMAHREPGLVEKSKDCGASVLSMCLAAALCLLNPGTIVHVGSRKMELVDTNRSPDCLLWKARYFLNRLSDAHVGAVAGLVPFAAQIRRQMPSPAALP